MLRPSLARRTILVLLCARFLLRPEKPKRVALCIFQTHTLIHYTMKHRRDLPNLRGQLRELLRQNRLNAV
jgi:hypothetical protein